MYKIQKIEKKVAKALYQAAATAAIKMKAMKIEFALLYVFSMLWTECGFICILFDCMRWVGWEAISTKQKWVFEWFNWVSNGKPLFVYDTIRSHPAHQEHTSKTLFRQCVPWSCSSVRVFHFMFCSFSSFESSLFFIAFNFHLNRIFIVQLAWLLVVLVRPSNSFFCEDGSY